MPLDFCRGSSAMCVGGVRKEKKLKDHKDGGRKNSVAQSVMSCLSCSCDGPIRACRVTSPKQSLYFGLCCVYNVLHACNM